MELDKRLDIDVTDAVAIGQKCSVDMVPDPPDAPARLGVLTGIDEGDAPFLLRSGQDRPLAGLEIDGEVGDMTEIIVKILFDDITLVTAADDEFVDAVTGERLHDVPQDRLSADFYHGLGYQ